MNWRENVENCFEAADFGRAVLELRGILRSQTLAERKDEIEARLLLASALTANAAIHRYGAVDLSKAEELDREAVSEYAEILRLDPGDFMAIRGLIATCAGTPDWDSKCIRFLESVGSFQRLCFSLERAFEFHLAAAHVGLLFLASGEEDRAAEAFQMAFDGRVSRHVPEPDLSVFWMAQQLRVPISRQLSEFVRTAVSKFHRSNPIALKYLDVRNA